MANWDSSEVRRFVVLLEWRRNDIGDLGEDMLGHPSIGLATRALAERVCVQSMLSGAGERSDWSFGRSVSQAVLDALEQCHKPFQLWNVDRIELDEPFELEPQPELKVGQACQIPAELQARRFPQTSTQVLVKQIDYAKFQRECDRANGEEYRYLWREPLPFGKPNPPEEDK